MTDNFEKKVAVDGPVVNAGELGSSTFSPGQALPAGPLGLGQRWTVARKREVVLRLLRDEPVQLLSRQLGVEIFRLEQWLLSPARRRQCVDHLQAELGISERRACAVAGQHRSTQRKRPRGRDDEEALTAAIIRLASQYGRYGYRRITALLRTEGWHVNAKRVQRIWRREGLKVPQKQPKRGRLWLNAGRG